LAKATTNERGETLKMRHEMIVTRRTAEGQMRSISRDILPKEI
jgi:hypothetical protein